MTYEKPDVSVDIVLLTLIESSLYVALQVRDKEPEQGKWALPGGYIHTNEDADDREAALRILSEKVGFKPSHLEQVCTEANAIRDERGWSASIVQLALCDPAKLSDLVDEREDMKLFSVEDEGTLLPADIAFDHQKLIAMAVDRLRAKAPYSSIVGYLLPKVFSIPDLHAAYEAVRKTTVNISAFRAKIFKEKVLVSTGKRLHATGRPADAYKLTKNMVYFTSTYLG